MVHFIVMDVTTEEARACLFLFKGAIRQTVTAPTNTVQWSLIEFGSNIVGFRIYSGFLLGQTYIEGRTLLWI
jgi:hypothetical protein